MNFSEQLNEYIDKISCTSQELANASGISPAVISRYRSGQRKPKLKSPILESLADGLAELSVKNGTPVSKENILAGFSASLNDVPIDFIQLKNNFNTLISGLNINVAKLSHNICIDASLISKIRSGQIAPSNPIEFIDSVSHYIVQKYNDQHSKEMIAGILNCKISDLQDDSHYLEVLNKWISSNTSSNNTMIHSFLNNLDQFDIEEYIKVIKFDEIKIPFIPFYSPTAKTYTGIKEMRTGELDFFKATVMSKSTAPVFMCNDVPMEKLVKDKEWAKKYMFGIAMMLKKGLHINMIHTLNRPFKEILLGLENWIPLYMTGQVSAYYFKNFNDRIYTHTNNISGSVALVGESIRGYQEQGRYYLVTNKKDVEYYHAKAQLLLSKASPLFHIYTEASKKEYYAFREKDSKCSGKRKRILCSLPIHTISKDLLIRILKHNHISEENARQILSAQKKNAEIVARITEQNIFEDVIPEVSKESFQHSPVCLSIIDTFIDTRIYYTYEEYLEHLNLSKEYAEHHQNYVLRSDPNWAFKNIQITICENKWAMFSKNTHPVIHFYTTHPSLREGLENFTPLITDAE